MEAVATVTLKQDEIKRILTEYVREQGYDIQELHLKTSHIGQRQEEAYIIAVANLEIKPKVKTQVRGMYNE